MIWNVAVKKDSEPHPANSSEQRAHSCGFHHLVKPQHFERALRKERKKAEL
jgi:hypothetical protein